MRKISTISKIVSEFFLVTTIGISCAGFAETREISNGGLSQEKVQLRENEPCCGPINAGGRRVLEVLDHADVEHLWLPRQHVNWETGQPESSAPVYSSHCSAFAAAPTGLLCAHAVRTLFVRHAACLSPVLPQRRRPSAFAP